MSTTSTRKPAPRRTARVTRGDRFRSSALLIAGTTLVIALATAHPSGWVPHCPTHQFLGFYCPGCGSMRATHLLLRGDVAGAFTHNPLLLILGVPLALLFWGEQIMIVLAARRIVFIPRSARLAWIALIVLLLFTLLRNLPGGVGSALSPPESTARSHMRSISTPPGIALRNERP